MNEHLPYDLSSIECIIRLNHPYFYQVKPKLRSAGSSSLHYIKRYFKLTIFKWKILYEPVDIWWILFAFSSDRSIWHMSPSKRDGSFYLFVFFFYYCVIIFLSVIFNILITILCEIINIFFSFSHFFILLFTSSIHINLLL